MIFPITMKNKKSQGKIRKASFDKGIDHKDKMHLIAPPTAEELKQQLSLCTDTTLKNKLKKLNREQ